VIGIRSTAHGVHFPSFPRKRESPIAINEIPACAGITAGDAATPFDRKPLLPGRYGVTRTKTMSVRLLSSTKTPFSFCG
jgi:hypothetical protein